MPGAEEIVVATIEAGDGYHIGCPRSALVRCRMGARRARSTSPKSSPPAASPTKSANKVKRTWRSTIR
jgi:hypothetical protein